MDGRMHGWKGRHKYILIDGINPSPILEAEFKVRLWAAVLFRRKLWKHSRVRGGTWPTVSHLGFLSCYEELPVSG